MLKSSFRIPGTLLLILLLCTSAPAQKKAVQPNFLWLSVEDLSPYIGTYGHPLALTPNLDALAAKSTRYTHAYSNGVQCSPARSTLISGMYAPMLGTDMHREKRAVPKDFYFPQLLRKAGYYATNASKQDYNSLKTPADVWDNSGRNATYLDRPDKSQPFFAVFNEAVTHMSRMTKHPLDDRADRVIDPADVTVPAYIPDLPEVRDDIAWHLDAVTEMDQWVGEKLAELEASGEAGNTIVFFFSDHGGSIPRGKAYVYEGGGRVILMAYVPPALRRQLDIEQPAVSERLVCFADFAPTLLTLADQPVPERMVGTPFLGRGSDRKSEWAEDVLLFRSNQDASYAPARALIDGRYKLIANYQTAYPDGTPQRFQWQMPAQRAWQQACLEGNCEEVTARFWEPNPPFEFYDLQQDPDEVVNLIDDPTLTPVVVDLKSRLSTRLREIKDLGFIPPGMREPNNPEPIYYRVRENGRDIEAIITAAELAQRIDPGQAPALLGLLSDDDPAIRYWAASGLTGLLKREKARDIAAEIPALLREEEEGEVRTLLAEALIYSGDPDLTETGRQALLAELRLGESSAFAALQNVGELAAPLVTEILRLYGDLDDSHQFYLRSTLINTGHLPYEDLYGPENSSGQVQALVEAQANLAPRPNVLWITIEDTSPQFIGGYGNPDVHTPNIDRLMSEGVRFDRAFAPAPVCAIARNALITGMYPGKLGTGHHRSGYPIPEWIRGYPAYLRDEGYYTTNNSKTDYNNARAREIIAESWDESSNHAGWWKRAPGQPFFSVFNFNESHQSRTMTNPRAWYEENVLREVPDALRSDSATLTVPPVFRDSPAMRGHLARVYNSINYVDLRIGELLARLEAEGLRDSTIIFFYADHGEAVPGGKCTATGLGYRVPFAMWFPPAYRDLSPWATGSVSDELLVFEDLGPSLIGLTGGQIPDYMDGRSLLGNARKEAPKYILAGRNRLDETPDLARSITDGRYIYTRNFLPQYMPLKYQKYADVSDIARTIRQDGQNGKLDTFQRRLLQPQPSETLYDLETDPWELHNLLEDPAHRERLAEMRTALHDKLLEIRDVHFLPEGDLASLEMPYEFRENRKLYPLEKILVTAESDPESPAGKKQLLADLRDSSSTVRYWAAAALSRRPFDGEVARALESVITDPSAQVAVQAAGGLVRQTRSQKAAEVLSHFAVSTDPYLMLAALQQIQYAGARRSEFLSIVAQSLPVIERVQGRNVRYNLQSCVETTLYLEGESPLFYDNMERWLRK